MIENPKRKKNTKASFQSKATHKAENTPRGLFLPFGTSPIPLDTLILLGSVAFNTLFHNLQKMAITSPSGP
jgi:hypothetical protein